MYVQERRTGEDLHCHVAKEMKSDSSLLAWVQQEDVAEALGTRTGGRVGRERKQAWLLSPLFDVNDLGGEEQKTFRRQGGVCLPFEK